MHFARYNKGLLFFPEILFQCIDINVINLEENYIRTIDAEIGLLTNLTDLIVYDNLISVLPPELQLNTKLRYFDISNNYLTSIPPFLFNRLTITFLDFSHNYIESLPDEITELVNLKHLNISDNGIEELPRNLADMTSLVFLDISNNKIGSLPNNLSNLTKLTEFYMVSNKIEDLPIDFILYFAYSNPPISLGLNISSYLITNNIYYGKNLMLLEDIDTEIDIINTIECPLLEFLVIPSKNTLIKSGYPCIKKIIQT